MRRAVTVLACAFVCGSAALAMEGDWAYWRGPNADGMARGDAPLHWSDSDGVRWKVTVPGRVVSPHLRQLRVELSGDRRPAREPVWQKDFGRLTMYNTFGEGAWTWLEGDTLLVVLDHEDESFLVALDTQTGRERWRAPRAGNTNWSGPFVTT
jgi:hypothetical protein